METFVEQADVVTLSQHARNLAGPNARGDQEELAAMIRSEVRSGIVSGLGDVALAP